MFDEFREELSFLYIFPDGKFGCKVEQDIKLTPKLHTTICMKLRKNSPCVVGYTTVKPSYRSHCSNEKAVISQPSYCQVTFQKE